MNINHIHTELNKIDGCLEKLYKKHAAISWGEAESQEVSVIQDYIDTINAKLSTYRARIGQDFKHTQGADYAT